MVKLNALLVATASVPGILAQGALFEVKANAETCDGGLTTYSCAGSPNLPGPPLSQVPTFNFVIGFPDTHNSSSPACGLCFRLTYTTPSGAVTARNVTVVTNSQPVVIGEAPVINLCTDAYRNLTGITGPLPSQLFAELQPIARVNCGL